MTSRSCGWQRRTAAVIRRASSFHLDCQLLNALGQKPEREDGCVASVGTVGAPVDECRVGELGERLAQHGIDSEEYGLELVLRLRAGLDGRLLRQPQHAHVGRRPFTGLGRDVSASGQHGTGSSLCIDGVALAVLAADGAVGLVDLDDLDALPAQEACEGRSVGSGAFHTGSVQGAEGACPGQELSVSGAGGRELLVGQERSEHGDYGGDMHVLVGVHSQDHIFHQRFFRLCGQSRLGHAGDGHAAASSARGCGRHRAGGRSEL
ncbi:Hypothetical Protein sle_09670 [Streptomyces leeuwenhoekii]|uniref:Uncharacterized protein n=1 Tax=Streptomyces leeuwenhoekii TaxID=1437453 RepID=A0A0F7VMC1_STRLW|nr:Hypothetical Protein sle_09670 [Streptomyces leeuwenhoekii]